MYLKVMSWEDIPDENNSKEFEIIECARVQFVRCTPGPNETYSPGASALLVYADGSRDVVDLHGNAYILNNAGKTIDSFAFAEYRDNSTNRMPHPRWDREAQRPTVRPKRLRLRDDAKPGIGRAPSEGTANGH